MHRKLGSCASLGEGELGPYLTQCGQGRRYLHAEFHLNPSNRYSTPTFQTGQDRTDVQTDRQRSDRIGRTVLQTVAQKLVASYDIRPGNGDDLFWTRCFINVSLTYLDTYPLTAPGPTRGKRAHDKAISRN